MAAAFRAVHLRARHAVGLIDGRPDRVLSKRRVEAGPAAATLVLRVRGEERLAAAGAAERAFALFLVQRARSARLGPMLTQDLVLRWRQLGLPLLIGLGFHITSMTATAAE